MRSRTYNPATGECVVDGVPVGREHPFHPEHDPQANYVAPGLMNSPVLPDQYTAPMTEGVSDGSTADYYELPEGATELQHLISHKDMNSQIGEIFRAAYRYGESSHSGCLRDAKKIRFYIQAEIERLEKLT